MRVPHVRRRTMSAVAGLALIGAGLGTGIPATANAQTQLGTPRADRGAGISRPALQTAGKVNLRALAIASKNGRIAPATTKPRTEIPPRLGQESDERQDGLGTPKRAPQPGNSPVTTSTPGAMAFEGLTIRDGRYADGGNQFTSEPPDQALCTGAGFTMEGVNTAIAVYDGTGAQLAPTVSINEFFGLANEFNRDKVTFGPSSFDPVCLYDAQIHRWIFLVTELDQDPFSGALTGGSHLFFAVSTSADPLGGYARYSITTTSGDGTDRGCPCFEDFPHIGTDANGLYITANRFAIFNRPYNGAQLYAISKTGLAANAAGTPDLPVVVSRDIGKIDGGKSYTVQPAASPPGGQFPHREYFLTTTHENSLRSDRIGVLALTGTASLADQGQALRLTRTTIHSRQYVQEPNVEQKPGPAPLAGLAGEAINALDSASAMSEVEFSQGRLWAATGTAVGNGADRRDGVLWFQVRPGVVDGHITARMVHQGYVSVDTNSLMYPAIGVNAKGSGAMVASMAGPTVYPSPSYVAMNLSGRQGPVRVPDFGKRPDDGFTCYAAFVGSRHRGCRWGDYSAATADARGRVWMATEWISGSARVPFANWSTEVIRYQP